MTTKRRNQFHICHKCKHMNLKSMRQKLRKLDPESRVKVSCRSYCGPCARGVFVSVNGRFVTGATEDEAIEKATKYMR